MMQFGASAAVIRASLSAVREIIADLCIILIMGRRETTVMKGRYEGFSLATSLYYSFEVDDIIAAFRSAGVYVEYFEDELDFIAWHQRGGFDRLPRTYKLVYTFAINGTGPGRRSLVPAYCSREQIFTVNSDAYTCAIGRHKFHCNRLLHTFGILVPRSWSYDYSGGWFSGHAPPIGLHVIGKATYEDGSIGLTKATIGTYTPAMDEAFAAVSSALKQPLTVQEFIAGEEIEVPVFDLGGYQAPSAVVLRTDTGERFGDTVISYQDSWKDNTQYASASLLSPTTAEWATRAAQMAATALGHRGFARVDFRIADDGRPFVIDTAAHPHLTKNSSYLFLFDQLGFSFDDMMLTLAASGAKRFGFI
jgi:D-alanine-D-alanine ligase